MRFTNTICVIILAATAASAVAIPEPRCGKVGQPCGKRDALALPEAFAEARCGRVGQPCGRVKRAAEALAEAFAEPSAEPEDAEIEARCNLVGGACFEAKRLARDLASVVAHATDDPEAFYNSLDLEDEESKFPRPPFHITERLANMKT